MFKGRHVWFSGQNFKECPMDICLKSEGGNSRISGTTSNKEEPGEGLC